MKKNVVLVRQGGWGQVTKPEYHKFGEFLRRQVEKLNAKKSEQDQINFEIVDDIEAINDRLHTLNDIDTLIFISRSEIDNARKIKKQYSHIENVIVLTGLIPDDEILIIEKTWLTEDLLKQLLFF
ncbi:hypothetical protein ACFL2U_01185 [Patescibacteria group bacterium]